MAKVEVKDLKNKQVGELELNDAIFDYRASETLVWEAVRAFLAGRRKRNPQGQEPGRGSRRWGQTVAPEGNRSRSRWQPAKSAVAERRDCVWSPAS